MKQSYRTTLRTILTGMAMGLADLVPGVSGGTIVFISGLYPRFVSALASIDQSLLPLLFKGKFSAIRKTIDGTFLVTLIGGILISVALFSTLIHSLLESQPILMGSLFGGFVFGCCLILGLQYGVRTAPNRMAIRITLGAVIGRFLTTNFTAALPSGGLGVFIAGAFGSIAMILPGISGSYILVILGVYESIIGTISSLFSGNMDALGTVVLFGLGVVVGLLAFSKLLRYLLARFETALVLILVGVMLGALPTLLPGSIGTGYALEVFGAFVIAASLTGWLMSEGE